MASNKRENARREKQQQKEIKTKKIIWIVLAVVIAILIIMKVCEVNFSAIKNRVESGNLSITSSADTSVYPFKLDSSNVVVNSINDKLNLLTDSTVTVLNPTNANVDYTFTHGYSNPIISYSGNYFCIFDQGANRFRLDTNLKNVYEQTIQQPILCADVSKNGKVVYVTRGENSKSVINVVTKSLVNNMSLEFNDGYIVDVAIDSSGKKIAVASVSSVEAQLVTTVYTYSVGDSQPVAKFDFVGSNVMDIHYSNSSDLYYVGTNCVSVIKNQKKAKTVFDIGTVNTVCFSYTDDNELAYVYSEYADANENILSYINSSAKVKMNTTINDRVKNVSSANDNVTVLCANNIYSYSLTSGKLKASYPCNDSINNAYRMSSKTFVTYQQLVDVVE